MTLDMPGTAGGIGALSGAAWLSLAGEVAALLPTGALWLPGSRLLAVGDLHLGKSERLARRGGALLPPYETADTLARLARLVEAVEPLEVVCVGDSFDDGGAAAALAREGRDRLGALMSARGWTWIAGNHDPRPTGLGGISAPELTRGPVLFRHIAGRRPPENGVEVSAHYHPKARLCHRGRRISRPCFLWDGARLILPAFGTYTGGLDAQDPALRRLLGPRARAYLTGRRVTSLPVASLG